MTDWKHSHSIILGVIVGLMLAHHIFWIVAVTLGLGVAVGRTWGGLSRIVRDATDWLHNRAQDGPRVESVRTWPPRRDDDE